MVNDTPGTIALHWLPTEPPRPCPAVLTADEAVIYLRLTGERPLRTLDYYRRHGLLPGYRIGRHVRFRREDLDRFIDSKRC